MYTILQNSNHYSKPAPVGTKQGEFTSWSKVYIPFCIFLPHCKKMLRLIPFILQLLWVRLWLWFLLARAENTANVHNVYKVLISIIKVQSNITTKTTAEHWKAE